MVADLANQICVLVLSPRNDQKYPHQLGHIQFAAYMVDLIPQKERYLKWSS